MARRHRHRHRRDVPYIANRPDPVDTVVDLFTPVSHFSPVIRSPVRKDVEDHRTWSPDAVRRPRLTSSRQSQVQLAKPRRPLARSAKGRSLFSGLSRLAFKTPKHVLICVRRKQRREVLLAKGRGGGGHRPPRRRMFSDVRC